MTSKQALEKLHEKLLRYDEHYDYNDTEIINQDLEILEILKEQAHNFSHILYRNMHLEETDKWLKVKEWLDNDK